MFGPPNGVVEIEVAQIGRSICAYLLSRGEPLKEDFYIDADLVEASSLSHDMGHPPFGHSGERTLQELMKRRGGFERTLAYVTGLSNVRDVIPFPRTPGNAKI